MRWLHILAAASFVSGATGCRHAEPPKPAVAAAKAELRQVDLRQSQIVQSGDVQALTGILHPGYLVHLPNGRVVDFDQTIALVKTGSLARERHSRTQERVLIDGDTGVVMGVDRLEAPPPLARQGERTRRYTNVYVREKGRWRLLARHFHFLP